MWQCNKNEQWHDRLRKSLKNKQGENKNDKQCCSKFDSHPDERRQKQTNSWWNLLSSVLLLFFMSPFCLFQAKTTFWWVRWMKTGMAFSLQEVSRPCTNRHITKSSPASTIGRANLRGETYNSKKTEQAKKKTKNPQTNMWQSNMNELVEKIP